MLKRKALINYLIASLINTDGYMLITVTKRRKNRVTNRDSPMTHSV